MANLFQPFRDGSRTAWGLVAIAAVIAAATGALLVDTLQVRFRRDINRIVFNHNWELLDRMSRRAGLAGDSLERALAASPEPPAQGPYIVVSIEDRRLWYRDGDQILYTTAVAVGSGKTLIKHGGREEYKFDTPRGRLVVQSKEADPVWVPPDWHYVELAKQRGLGIVQLRRSGSVAGPDGSVLAVVGNDVVWQRPDGRVEPLEAGEGRELSIGGNIIVPPFGTNQRKFPGVLGTHRLNLGDGYALHGTDKPASIGRAVSHGCVRLRNEDIAYLYSIVPVGTPVYIY